MLKNELVFLNWIRTSGVSRPFQGEGTVCAVTQDDNLARLVGLEHRGSVGQWQRWDWAIRRHETAEPQDMLRLPPFLVDQGKLWKISSVRDCHFRRVTPGCALEGLGVQRPVRNAAVVQAWGRAPSQAPTRPGPGSLSVFSL